jgi:hypothetical protein
MKYCVIILIRTTIVKAERRGRNLGKGKSVRWSAEELAVFKV